MANIHTTQYGQDPNRITDISTFLSISQSFSELEKLINSFGRTLTDNERRLQQTLPGIIKTFNRVEKEFKAGGSKKINGGQAADLKVMLANKENILKWLDQLSKFDPKTGLAKNSRNDKSFMEYAKIFEEILDKMTSSMEKSYRQMNEYYNTVNAVKNTYGTSSNNQSPISKVNPPSPSSPIAPPNGTNFAYAYLAQQHKKLSRGAISIKDAQEIFKKFVSQSEPKISAVEELGKLLAQGKIDPNTARRMAYQAQIQKYSTIPTKFIQIAQGKIASSIHKALQGKKQATQTGGVYGFAGARKTSPQPLTGAAKYAGPRATTQYKSPIGPMPNRLMGPIRANWFDRKMYYMGDNPGVFKSLHTALSGLPIFGSASGLVSNMAQSGSSMKDFGDALQKSFSSQSIVGKAGKLLAGPIGVAIGAGATALGAIYKQLKKSSPILQAVSDLFNLAWTLLWMPLGNALGTLLLPMAEDLINFSLAFNRLFTDFSMSALRDLYWSMVQVVWGAIMDLTSSLPSAIVNFLIDKAIDFADAMGWDGVVTILEDYKKTFNNIYNGIRNIPTIISGMIESVISAISGGFSSLFSGGNFIEGAKSGFKNAWNDTVGAVTGVKLATGGVVTAPTFALVGEAGPEAVVPLDKMNGLGATYVININGDVYGVSDLEGRIERVIQRTANKSYYR